MTVTTSKLGPVFVVTINRPEARNAVNAETAAGLRAAFTAFENDGAASVAVLTGTGSTFCAGYDLTEAASGIGYDPTGPGPMGPTRSILSKPVIAAVEGHAVAGGLELALWCDMRVASDTAIFGVYCRRWGVPLVDGGTVRLGRAIGHSRAMDMILTGRSVDAAEALSWGLANRLVPAGAALVSAVALAKEISEFPQLCLRADRQSGIGQWGMPIGDALAAEAAGGVGPLSKAGEGAARFVDGEGRGGAGVS